MQLQQRFIDWVKSTHTGQKPVFLGGAIQEDVTSCFRVEDSTTTVVHNLKCTHEEADDRMMYHVNHAVQADFKKIIVASPDTDVFVNLVHHFKIISLLGPTDAKSRCFP